MMTSQTMDQTNFTSTNGRNGNSSGSTSFNGLLSSSPTNITMPTEAAGGLNFDNQEHPSELLVAMGNLRRQHQFCDAVLRVGEREVQVHRAVLAASSPVLFDLFERSADRHHGDADVHCSTVSMYKLKDLTFTGFSYLLDYMYSGRLNVAAQDVGEVYRTAKLLRMEQAAQACSTFLADHLTPSNCLGIRQFAADLTFKECIDNFIQKNVEAVVNSKYFLGLSKLKVEIVGAEKAVQNDGSVRQLFHLILDWARSNIDSSKPKLDILTEEVSVLYLNSDSHLQDCKDVDDSRISDDDVIVDYKKHSIRRSAAASKLSSASAERQVSVNGQSMPFHIFNINPEGGVAEKEWSVVAIMKQKGNSYMGLALLSGTMMSVSLHLRQVVSPNKPEDASTKAPKVESGERTATLLPLQAMSSSRCAFGVCVWEDSIVVCGGYDRGECLVSVEMYNPDQGCWSKLANMLTPRARFGAAALHGRLYAIGGSDGTRDLHSVHCLTFATQKWEKVAPLQTPRSSVGVAELSGRLYCVGGSEGQLSLDTCEVYDVEKNQWTFFASLNTARFQASVCTYKGSLIAVGGTDSWNCLNTVEMYSPDDDTWTYISSLGTIRRGTGIDVVADKLWVVGGSDGASSLRSTEIYDPETKKWSVGPSLNVPRANVSAVSLKGNLYAIGGFSGKKFLNTLEVLAEDSHEWCCFQPNSRNRKKRNGSANSSGDEQQQQDGVHSDIDAFHSDQEANSADEAKVR